MYKGKVNVKSEVSTEELANSIIEGISNLKVRNTDKIVSLGESISYGNNEYSATMFTTNDTDTIGGRAVICTEDEIITSISESGKIIGESIKGVSTRINSAYEASIDKTIYYIVLKSGREVECFSKDMDKIMHMMGNDDLYVVQENDHPGYSTFINKEDVVYFRFPSNAKGMLKPWK